MSSCSRPTRPSISSIRSSASSIARTRRRSRPASARASSTSAPCIFRQGCSALGSWIGPACSTRASRRPRIPTTCCRIFERQPKHLLSDEIGVFYRKHRGGITENRVEAQRELMRAFFRAHRRCGRPFLPDGIVTIAAEHLAEVRSWVG